ncbi:MAG: class I SAM-dependent methyltransferase [Promethearchaeota archaeon]
MKKFLTVFGIVHWGLIGFLIYYSIFVLKINWSWILFGFLVYLVFFFLVIVRIIRHYYHFPIPSIMTQVIDNPLRRKFIQNPEIIADRMQLEPGMNIVEIGPGKGHYTIAVAKRILPDGKVYAVDISEKVINLLKRKIEKERITNIIPQIENAHAFSFSNESIDRVFAIACLPEIPEPVKVLKECYRILKPMGLVSLCELFIDPDYPRRKTEMKWARKAGFELEQGFGNWFAYQLNFRKKFNKF